MIRLRGLGKAVGRGLRLCCPRCGQGRLFRGPFRIVHDCPQCHLHLEREPGYYIGAIYLNYGATVVLAVTGYFLLQARAAPPLAVQVALWGAFCVAFPLWAFRYSKSLWLALDHFVDPEPEGGGQPPDGEPRQGRGPSKTL